MTNTKSDLARAIVGLMGPAVDEKQMWLNYKASYWEHLAEMDQEALMRVVSNAHTFEAEFRRLNPGIPDTLKTPDDFWDSTIRLANMDPEERKKILKTIANAIRNRGEIPKA